MMIAWLTANLADAGISVENLELNRLLHRTLQLGLVNHRLSLGINYLLLDLYDSSTQHKCLYTFSYHILGWSIARLKCRLRPKDCATRNTHQSWRASKSWANCRLSIHLKRIDPWPQNIQSVPKWRMYKLEHTQWLSDVLSFTRSDYLAPSWVCSMPWDRWKRLSEASCKLGRLTETLEFHLTETWDMNWSWRSLRIQSLLWSKKPFCFSIFFFQSSQDITQDCDDFNLVDAPFNIL